MNRQDLLDAIVAAIYENTSGAITGQSLQDVLKEIVGAFTFIDEETAQPADGMEPGILYNLGLLAGNTTFALAAGDYDVSHYYWTFDTPAVAPTITWPPEIVSWQNNNAPTIDANLHYEISVLNGVGAWMVCEA